LKNNPLDDDLQSQAGKCLNKKECRTCAQRILQYMQVRKEEYEKEEAIKLKKKQANEKAKAKKREKQAEKEREEKRLKRLEHAQKRAAKKQEQQNKQQDSENEQDSSNETNEKGNSKDKDESPGFSKSIERKIDSFSVIFGFSVSETIDGILNGLFLSLIIIFAYFLYHNRQQPLNLREFYKFI